MPKMSRNINDSDSIKQYLLGELSGDELEAVERRMLSDADYYEQVLIADDELMHEFVNNELSDSDRAQFKKHALSVPQRRRGVKFVQALDHYVQKNAAQNVVPMEPVVVQPSWGEVLVAFFRRPAVGFACSVALLITLAPILWLLRENQRLRKELAQAPSQQALQEELRVAREQNRTLSEEIGRKQDLLAQRDRELLQLKAHEQGIDRTIPPSPESNTSLEIFPIALGMVREGGNGNKVSFRPDAKRIRLDIDLAANDFKMYRVALKRNGVERSIWSGPAEHVIVEPAKITLPVIVPTSILTRAEYEIDVRGIKSSRESEHVDTYYFRVP